MYEYKLSTIKSIYDGDTITCEVDLGFGVKKMEKFRLSFINAPEIRGEQREEGLKSRNWLRARMNEAIENGNPIIVKTTKDRKGKYGRYLAEFFINDISINQEMIRLGYATAY